ncbi:hypothetical protein HHI36_009914 [Cryptolaemus montrouzieri]|uniref:Uncharacterized protein n=1 Tax=Cryptolaemus montrouzieri TaxID=559131 RepID=A0ABD2MH54_9CUCU
MEKYQLNLKEMEQQNNFEENHIRKLMTEKDCLLREDKKKLINGHIRVLNKNCSKEMTNRRLDRRIASCLKQARKLDATTNDKTKEIRHNSEKTLIKEQLLDCDEYSKGFRGILDSTIDRSRFHIEALIRNNIETADLTGDLFEITKFHTEWDYIKFTFSIRNVSNHRTLNACLKNLIPIAKMTNLIVIVDYEMSEDFRIIKKIDKSGNFRTGPKLVALNGFSIIKEPTIIL